MYENYSVLMSVYIKEKPEYLKKSIESILNQSLQTNDFIIVEDGPLTAELNAVLDSYSEENACIHLLKRRQNAGLGAALNFGLQHCRNELVARMDSDDISLPDRCEKELMEFNQDSELDIVGTAVYEFSGDEKNIVSMKRMPVTQDEIKKYAARRNPFNHPTVMYKKKTVIKYGGYTEGQRGEDFELFTKMVFSGVRGKNIDIPLLKYRAVENQYERRTSKVDTMAVINVVKKNYAKGYISFHDFLHAVIVQITAFVIPKKLGKILYQKVYRSKWDGDRRDRDKNE